MTTLTLDRESAFTKVRQLIKPAGIVLEFGVGLSPQDYIKPAIHICTDIYAPYIEKLASENTDASRVFQHGHWFDVMKMYVYGSVDTIMAFDFIEHLDRKRGHRFIIEAMHRARQQIVLFMPLGEYKQEYAPGDKDNYGFDNWQHQTHRSAWTPDDFEGWTCVVVEDFHRTDQHGNALETPIGAFWAVLDLS